MISEADRRRVVRVRKTWKYPDDPCDEHVRPNGTIVPLDRADHRKAHSITKRREKRLEK